MRHLSLRNRCLNLDYLPQGRVEGPSEGDYYDRTTGKPNPLWMGVSDGPARTVLTAPPWKRLMRRASFVLTTRPINSLTEALGAARLDAD
jgi:hypothetical protein